MRYFAGVDLNTVSLNNFSGLTRVSEAFKYHTKTNENILVKNLVNYMVLKKYAHILPYAKFDAQCGEISFSYIVDLAAIHAAEDFHTKGRILFDKILVRDLMQHKEELNLEQDVIRQLGEKLCNDYLEVMQKNRILLDEGLEKIHQAVGYVQSKEDLPGLLGMQLSCYIDLMCVLKEPAEDNLELAKLFMKIVGLFAAALIVLKEIPEPQPIIQSRYSSFMFFIGADRKRSACVSEGEKISPKLTTKM